MSLVLAPLGRAEGKWCKTEPLRSLLTVVPSEETTKHRFPVGRANTYLEKHKPSENPFLHLQGNNHISLFLSKIMKLKHASL